MAGYHDHLTPNAEPQRKSKLLICLEVSWQALAWFAP